MEQIELEKIWNDTITYLKENMDNSNVGWITQIYPTGIDNGIFYAVTDKTFALSMIKQNCISDIKNAIKIVSGCDLDFQISLDKEATDKIKSNQKKREKLEKKIEKSEGDVEKKPNIYMQSTNLNLKYKFENFVVGDNSKTAYSIAKMVAEKPAEAFNPLYIYGGSGLGKTHLMQSIGHYAIFNLQKKRVKYVKTQDFINEYIDSVWGKEKSEKMAKFRQRFKNLDILLLDDIQFVESKQGTQDELFLIFDTLQQSHKQIVLTSDRLPKDIPSLPDRLRTRFEMGIVVDIQPPSFETRVEILKKWASDLMLVLDNDVCCFIAQNFSNNVRELEGVFNKVIAFAEIEKTEITLPFVERILKSETKRKKITIENIALTVAEAFDVTLKDLKSSARPSQLSRARQYIVYLAREMTKLSYEEIADFLDKKHTTMLYCHDKIVEQANKDIKVRETIRELKQAIKCNAV